MMNANKPVFREATYEERLLVKKTFDYFCNEHLLKPLEGYQLWVRDGKIVEIYGVPNHTNDLLKNITTPIYSSGIPLGIISQEKFHLEIEGALLILPSTDKVVEIKTDQFLYGKPIYAENIVETSYIFEKEELVIIIGRNGLHYGLGRTLISFNELNKSEPNTIVIKGYKNLPRDRGWYLRKGN